MNYLVNNIYELCFFISTYNEPDYQAGSQAGFHTGTDYQHDYQPDYQQYSNPDYLPYKNPNTNPSSTLPSPFAHTDKTNANNSPDEFWKNRF